MSVKIEDKGVLAALLDEAEELLSSQKPKNAEKIARLLNQLTNKAAELIDEKMEEEFTLNLSVSLPPRYSCLTSRLDALYNEYREEYKEEEYKQKTDSGK